MNPSSFKEAEQIFDSIPKENKDIEVVVAPPIVYLEKLGASASAKGFGGLRFASQNCFWENSGAYTGEISPIMLKNLGVDYVIIGHSERRKYLNETDEMINKKVLAGLKAGLKVILCVGEDLAIRKRGQEAAKDYVKKQLEKNLKEIGNWELGIGNLVVAYEPVWAISGNKNSRPDTPENALEMIKFIKKTLNLKPYTLNPKILYGGSVDSKNIKNFLKYKEIDGALVGGASLKKDEVKKIWKMKL